MKKLILISFLIPLVISVACSKNEDQAVPVTAEIFPLKVGNKWNYLVVRNDSIRSNHVNEVIKDTLCDGQSWYVLTYDTAVRTICKNTPDGWWFLYSKTPDLPGEPSLYYRYPARVNDQYLTADSTLVTVVSISEKVTVAAGTFTCYHYHMIHFREFYECDEFFAPGAGFIRHVVFESNSGISKVSEVTTLVSTNLP